jgi:RNA polymerase sigma-70 factor, ECF subfamily
VLFYLQGLKYREIADALCIPIGTVKSRLHNGLLRLKAALEEALEEVVR